MPALLGLHGQSNDASTQVTTTGLPQLADCPNGTASSFKAHLLSLIHNHYAVTRIAAKTSKFKMLVTQAQGGGRMNEWMNNFIDYLQLKLYSS